MSFTTEVKDELSRVEPTCSKCDKAELAALIRIAGILAKSGSGNYRLEIASETVSVARTAIRLLRDVYGLQTELTIRRSVLHKTHNFLITVPTQRALTDAIEDLGFFEEGVLTQGIPQELVESGCCAGAFLRGAFLTAGYIADPKGDFHFEISLSSEELASGLVDLMARCDLQARQIQRHNMYMVYMKGAEKITDFLAFIGAHKSVLAMEEARVVKSVRNDANRLANAEFANTIKSSEAASRQIGQIKDLLTFRKVDTLPPALQQVIILRLKDPEATITELGEMADPPLSKSAVYHRLRRIEELLAEERQKAADCTP